MTSRTRKSERRTDALSRERIIEAAVELLDAAGERGLTFRTLTERLATGPGAIYWHVANKSELLDAATDAVVAAALTVGSVPGVPGVGVTGVTGVAGVEGHDSHGAAAPVEPVQPAESSGADAPQDGIRAVALGLFDAIEAHPWLATQLATQFARSPGQSVTPRIFEAIGRQVRALGVPRGSWFTATSALVHYILGAAGQNVANTASGRALGPDTDRAEFLDAVSSAWEELDADDYPFTRAVAGEMRTHDDRAQFLAGITLILTGITALHPPTA